ncbi:hypothetical protein LTR08_000208 [Meristemomyces frigidus]|nr:hypothetical protein LTR08_000208 [Meristemomyces frigidus]
MSEIMRLKRHSLSTILSSPTQPDRNLTALPIYHEHRFSVHSSYFGSVFSGSKRPAPTSKSPKGTKSVPSQATKRSRAKQAPNPSNTYRPPQTPPNAVQTFLADPTPPLHQRRETDKIRVTPSPQIGLTQKSLESASKFAATGFAVSIREEPPDKEFGSLATYSETPGSPSNTQDRWSWTNSQAPATPRLYAPNRRSSISTLPRFRTIKSWVQGQTDRNPLSLRSTEEERLTTAQIIRGPMLKNKASLPKLAPPPAGKSSKQGSQGSRVSSVLRRQQSKKAPAMPLLVFDKSRPGKSLTIDTGSALK